MKKEKIESFLGKKEPEDVLDVGPRVIIKLFVKMKKNAPFAALTGISLLIVRITLGTKNQ